MAEATAPKIAFRPSRTGRDAETRGAPPAINEREEDEEAIDTVVCSETLLRLSPGVVAPVPASAAGQYLRSIARRIAPDRSRFQECRSCNGMARLPDMLNERDGGIGGVKILVEECETGYDTKKGVEC